MNDKEVAAGVLREAVHRAVKEWENSDRTLNCSGGTWKQDTWGTAQADLVQSWAERHIDGLSTVFLVAPVGETLSCGTTGCVAGHVAVQTGWQFCIPKYTVDYDFGSDERLELAYAVKGGVRDSIASIATETMGALGGVRSIECANGPDAWGFKFHHDLFSGSNTITHVVVFADRLLTMNGLEPTGVSTLGLPTWHGCKCYGEGQ